MKLTATQARKLGLKVPKAKRGGGQKSKLEADLAGQLEAAGIRFHPQYHAVGGRKAWDFMVYGTWKDVLVEVQGGIWMRKSGHNTGTGLTRDYEKNNAAAIAGYRTLYVTARDIKSGQALEWIRRAIS